MEDWKKKLALYANETLHWNMVIRPVRADLTKSLPYVVGQLYEFAKVQLFDLEMTIAKVRQNENININVGLLKKHYVIIKKSVKKEVVLIIEKADARLAQQLIRHGIQFITLNGEFYLPQIGIRLRAKTELTPPILRKTFTPLATRILIEYLLGNSIDNITGTQLAKKMGVTPMAISNALKELEQNNVCHIQKDGRQNRLNFPDSKALWSKVKDVLSTPVTGETYIVTKKKALVKELPLSGISALAKHTMLADDEVPTLAIHKKTFNEKINNKEFQQVEAEDADYKIELWNRKPTVIGNTVDPISLYLNLRNDVDERVQSELANYLNNSLGKRFR